MCVWKREEERNTSKWDKICEQWGGGVERGERKRILKTFNNTENLDLLLSDLNNVELLRNLWKQNKIASNFSL